MQYEKYFTLFSQSDYWYGFMRAITNSYRTVLITIWQIFSGFHIFCWFISLEFFLFGFLWQTQAIHERVGQGKGDFIPLYHFHLLTSIKIFICNFISEVTNDRNTSSCRTCNCQTVTRWDLSIILKHSWNPRHTA